MIPRWLMSWLLFWEIVRSWVESDCSVGVVADDLDSTTRPGPPNFVVLVVESTDGKTWQRGYQQDVIPLPNLRKLEDQGATSFYRHYCNIPVCCPSRASFWSGKYPHKIPHIQKSSSRTTEPYWVHGVWNNFEGLPENYTESMFHVLQDHGYTIHMSGKQDYQTGGHTLSVRMNAWTMYVDFPYNLTRQEPWVEESSTCRDNGTVTPTNPETPHESSSHKDDWKTLNETLDWIRDYHRRQQQQNEKSTTNQQAKPFFVYQGMNIVHPPYHTNEYWLHQINESKIHVPDWPAQQRGASLSSSTLLKMHPCDVHMSMLKGCLPTSPDEIEQVLSIQRRRHIRRIYYAMIAEFDAMVGKYMDTIEELGLTSNTIFIVTSDHGDMQMEHAQYYKMSPYDASSRVPLIIFDPRRAEKPISTNTYQKGSSGSIVDQQPTQHVDLFPTILDLAGLSDQRPRLALDGHSLVPLLSDQRWNNGDPTSMVHPTPRTTTTTHRELGEQDKKTMPREDRRPPYVVVQYHGDDSPMSWFAIVQPLVCMQTARPSRHHPVEDKNGDNVDDKDNSLCMYKLVIWGTGQQVDSQLFDLTHDVEENINLIHHPDYELIIGRLHTNLQSVVEYPLVAHDVAQYNRQSFQYWIQENPTAWKGMLNSTDLRWHSSWISKPELAWAALKEWLATNETTVKGCRRELAWPPNIS